ncbi:hypothetical protein JVU11DRAFT_9255 [Chiua virens]|nr:hypothetical protein JVU11DRAFT_9255 [Chiua virens]
MEEEEGGEQRWQQDHDEGTGEEGERQSEQGRGPAEDRDEEMGGEESEFHFTRKRRRLTVGPREEDQSNGEYQRGAECQGEDHQGDEPPLEQGNGLDMDVDAAEPPDGGEPSQRQKTSEADADDSEAGNDDSEQGEPRGLPEAQGRSGAGSLARSRDGGEQHFTH